MLKREGRIEDEEVDEIIERKMEGKEGNKDEIERIIVVDEDEMEEERIRNIMDENYRVDVESEEEKEMIRDIEKD